MSDTPTQSLSRLESRLQLIIQEVLALAKPTGYRWSKADEVITEETRIRSPRVYRVTEDGRLYNLAREIKRCPDLAVIVAREHGFTVDQLVERLVAYAPERSDWPALVIIMVENGAWYGKIALKRKDRHLPLDLAQHFPAVATTVEVPPARVASGSPDSAVAI